MPEVTDEAWEASEARMSAFGPVVKNLLGSFLDNAAIRCHSIEFRAKGYASAQRKFAEKSARYSSPLALTDLLGVRIITYFEDEVDAIASIIENEFEVDRENSVDKRAELAHDRFGYLSLHFVVKLNHVRSALGEYSKFRDVPFEIQIRSILQHAWAEIEHDIGYKSANAVPLELRRRFSRLAGLLEVADTEFTHIRTALAAHRQDVAGAVRANDLNIHLDRDSLVEYILQSTKVKEIEELGTAGAGWKLLNFEQLNYHANKNVGILLNLGFATIQSLDEHLSKNTEVLWRFMRNWLKLPNEFDDMEHEAGRGILLFYVVLAEISTLSEVKAQAVIDDEIKAEFSALELIEPMAEAQDEAGKDYIPLRLP